MSVKIEAGGPMAKALESIITPKLLEVGWSSDPQDQTLTEYIVLMLVNGKNQEEVARELSGDLLGLSSDDPSTMEFAQWLFQQIGQLNQGEDSSTSHGDAMFGGAAGDADMSDADGSGRRMYVRPTSAEKLLTDSRPTGPKAMRNGNGSNRMFNQVNRNMERSGDPLHRIQGSNGRINSHNRGQQARGNRTDRIQRNFDGAARRQIQNVAMNPMTQQGFAFPMGQMGQMGQPDPTLVMRMLEEQAAMIHQLAAQQQSTQQNGGGRGDRGRGRGNRHPRGGRQNRPNRDDEDTAMGEVVTGEDGNEEPKDPYKVLCRFNLYCTKPDCQFAHQSPAAPDGTTIDLDTDCTFGAACKNFKCVSRHPSPAKKLEHQQQQECKFGPYCQNPACAFKHTNAKPCRNGGDCTAPGCPFFHNTTECKFTPCTNAHCQYKHKEGQKAGAGHVWKAGGEHISDRKFVTDEGEPEEIIIPDATSSGGAGLDVEQPAPPVANALSG
jgi:hypothetical protein